MRVKELIDKVIKIARESADNEDGGIQIYTDYRDRELSNETIKTLFESNNPRETLVEMVSDNEMNYSDNYGYYELIETINKRLAYDASETIYDDGKEDGTGGILKLCDKLTTKIDKYLGN